MRSLLRLLPYLKRYSLALVVGIVALIGSNYFAVRGWAISQRAIDSFLVEGSTSRTIAYYAWLTFAVFLIGSILRFGMRWLIIGVSRKVEYDFRNDLFSHLQTLSPAYYDRHMTGDLMSRCTNDLDAVRMVLGPGIMMPVNTVVLVPMVLVQMLHISPLLTAVGLAPLLVAPILMRSYGRIIHRMFRSVQDYYSLLSARVQENLAGIRVVKSLAREDQEIETFETMNRHYRHLSMRMMTGMAFFFPIMRVMVGLGVAAIIYVGAVRSSEMLTGQAVAARGVSFGDLFAFIGLYYELIFPVVSLGWVVNVLEAGSASMKRIAEVLDTEPEIPPPGTGDKPAEASIRGEIEFRHLTFAYNGHPVLRDIDLRIPVGRTLGVVGPVGSGKSTLLALIPRLYSPPRGQLLIDGRDVNDIPVEALRDAVAMAPQETFLFSETLRENIEFGSTDGEAAMRNAARMAGMDETIMAFPHDYETELGERGINLSGGQKQRTALARALMRRPRILLLDDSLSSVDTETEEAILRNLRQELRGRTAILVSHRISTVQLADEIIVLDEGRIIERGTHPELVALNGLYAQIYRQQQLAESIEMENGNDTASAPDVNAACEPPSDDDGGGNGREGY